MNKEVIAMNSQSQARGGPKRLLLRIVAIGAMLPVVISATATAQEDSGGYVTNGGSQVQVTEVDGVRFFEASMSVTAQPGEGSPMARSSTSSRSAREVYFNNVLSANVGRAKWVRHYYAITQRVSGSGPYRAEAHATLIKGDSYEDEQVFSGHTHSCATVNVVNRTAKTCASPKFRTSPGKKWFAISGHSYDRGNDGTVEQSIAGELDFVWTAPSS